ncbi:membrane protein [Rhodococcus pyridinivorans KG-16]|uniref:Membrane protein n=1 Tax=Rhodococcus pyridinivorans KG-16 TaxID=1441730 RepID=A0A0V9UQF0_9NOCA|nr:VanW family protein [Rhodococcus pyridinivorans]KSZ60230.1 membrane protein [Rhodococcus pyridinivorans KG-16]
MSGSNGTDESPHEHEDARTENVGSTAESAREAEGASAPTERFEAVDPHREVAEPKASSVTEPKASSVTEPKADAEAPQPAAAETPEVSGPAETQVGEPKTEALAAPQAPTEVRADGTNQAAPTGADEPPTENVHPSEAPTAVIPVVAPGNRVPGDGSSAATDRLLRSQGEQNPAQPDPEQAGAPVPPTSTAMPSAAHPPQGDQPAQQMQAGPPPQGPPPVTPPPTGGPGGSGGDGDEPGKPGSSLPRRTIALVVGGVVALLAVFYVADLALSSGKVPRGVTVAGVEIGGMSLDAAEAELTEQLTPRLDMAVDVTAGDTQGQIVPSEAGIGIDWPATLDQVGSQPLNPFTRLASFFGNDEVGVVSTRDEAALSAAIEKAAAAAAHEPREGNIVFEDGTPVPVTPQPGQQLDVAVAGDVFAERWPYGDVSLPVESVDVTVTREGLDRALAEVAVPAVAQDLVVRGLDGAVGVLPRDAVGAVLSFVPDGSGGLQPQYNTEAAIGILAPQLAPSETEPKDARIVLDGGRPTIVPSETGEMVDWPVTLERLPDLLKEEGDRSTDAVYRKAEPELTTEGAEKLGIKEVVSEFTTSGFEYASGVNIRLAAQEINGAIVKPGETFSFNDYTGPRGAAQGYIESGIIEAGRPGKAVGGGISQLATTLYNATYFAGMEDVEHTEHSYYISRYPAAREATIYDGAIDLKFRNPFDTGVLIQTIGTSSDITVRIWGTKTVDVQSITGNRTNFTSPNTITLPAGSACIPSSGAQGFTVTDTRIVTDARTGAQISNATRTVRYDPVPIVKCISPEPEPSDEPSGGGDDATSGDTGAEDAEVEDAPVPAPESPAAEAPAVEAPAAGGTEEE